MKYIRIFELESPIEQALFAVPSEHGEDEMNLFFAKMSDPELVRSFCLKNRNLIMMTVAGTIEEVANDICDLAASMEERLFKCGEDKQPRLDELFTVIGVIGEGERAVQTCVSISGAVKSSLPYPELYALRLSPNCYLVTGGRICLPGSPEEVQAQKEVQRKWMDIHTMLV
jgi:hypothetical protein